MKFPDRTTSIVVVLLSSLFLLAMLPVSEEEKPYHSKAALDNYFASFAFLPPVDSSLIFPNASNCSGCHGRDQLMNALVDYFGNDVNMHDDWRSSMMANSAKDPFWQAKVSHEVLTNPNHSSDIQTKCTSCHAPQGHFTAILRGAEQYTIAEMLADTTAMDGVSCGACHMISPENLGTTFSGEIHYDTSRVIYGPYEMPFAAPMRDFVGFEPVYSEHINDAALCASCHTLLTNSVDLSGEYTGAQFVEQATYHEWLNSAYSEEGSSPMTCQSCHMPQLEEEVIIATNNQSLEPRSPFALHTLVGGNTTMLQLMKENKEALEIDAEDEHFDETIAATYALLQQRSISMSLELSNLDADTAYFSVRLRNRTGHKFPSGYPARRAFIEFVVLNEEGQDTLFQSGVLQADYEVKGQTAATEPHFDVINQEEQVQIYELVLGDVEGNFTTVLERSHQALKDNRLPPRGFTTSHSAYDTTQIYGSALEDSNFNWQDGEEGSGTDTVHYHFPLDGYQGLIQVSAKMYYQALPPKWMAPMFAESTPEIESFRMMYESADLSPVLVTQKSLQDILVNPSNVNEIADPTIIKVYPNPATEGVLYIQKMENTHILSVRVYDLQGRLLIHQKGNLQKIDLPIEQQMYLLEIETDKGRWLQRVLR